MKAEIKGHQTALSEYSKDMDIWETHEFAAMRQIISTIPDTIFIHVQNLATAAEMWEALRKEFEGRMQAVQNKLRN